MDHRAATGNALPISVEDGAHAGGLGTVARWQGCVWHSSMETIAADANHSQVPSV